MAKRKRLLAFLLVLIMAVSLVSTSVFANTTDDEKEVAVPSLETESVEKAIVIYRHEELNKSSDDTSAKKGDDVTIEVDAGEYTPELPNTLKTKPNKQLSGWMIKCQDNRQGFGEKKVDLNTSVKLEAGNTYEIKAVCKDKVYIELVPYTYVNDKEAVRGSNCVKFAYVVIDYSKPDALKTSVETVVTPNNMKKIKLDVTNGMSSLEGVFPSYSNNGVSYDYAGAFFYFSGSAGKLSDKDDTAVAGLSIAPNDLKEDGNSLPRYKFGQGPNDNNNVLWYANENVNKAMFYNPTGTLRVVFAARVYSVSYDWGTTDIPTGVTLPVDNNKYSNVNDIPVDNTYTENTVIYTADGMYTFSGWEDENKGDETVVNRKFIGSWTFTAIEKEIEDNSSDYFTITTVDADGNVLAGANYSLYQDDKVIPGVVNNGVVGFSGLEEGTYTLKETTAPKGYEKTSEEWTVKVDKDGTPVVRTPDQLEKNEKLTIWNWIIKVIKNDAEKIENPVNVLDNHNMTVTNNLKTYDVKIVLNGHTLSNTDYSEVASATVSVTYKDVMSVLNNTSISTLIYNNEVTFFERAYGNNKSNYKLSDRGPNYIGLLANGVEYGIESGMNNLSANNSLPSSISIDALERGYVINYYFAQIAHISVDNGHSATEGATDVKNIYTTSNTNFNVTVQKLLADKDIVNDKSLYNHKGWELNGTKYVVSGENADVVYVNNSNSSYIDVQSLVEAGYLPYMVDTNNDGVDEAWFNFVSKWSENKDNTKTLSYNVVFHDTHGDKEVGTSEGYTVTKTVNAAHNDRLTINTADFLSVDPFGEGHSYVEYKYHNDNTRTSIANGETLHVYYVRDTATLDIAKSFDGVNYRPESVTVTVTGPDDYSEIVVLNNNNQWNVVLEEVPTGTYTVVETENGATGLYRCTVAYNDEATGENEEDLHDGIITLVKDGYSSVEVVNTYSVVAVGPIVVPEGQQEEQLPEVETPLDEAPAEDPSEPAGEVEDMPEQQPALADAPAAVTGDSTMIFVVLVLMSGTALVATVVVGKKRTDK